MRNAKQSRQNRPATGSPTTASKYAVLGGKVGSSNDFGWDDIPATTVKLVVAAIVACGEAVMFSSTRQGGLSFTIYGAGEPLKVYRNDIESLTEALDYATETALESLDPETARKIAERCGR